MVRKLCFVGIGLMLSCSPRISSSPESKVHVSKPRNVILMIGDGMGISQITAGLYSNKNKLNLERCPVVGLSKTHSADNIVTDSAAGATAFSTGKKTYNGAIGVDADTVSQITLLELAEKKEMATGLVATSEITHATPACFYSHQPSRRLYEKIAEDLIYAEIEIFIGGGQKYFDDRKDKNNLLYTLKEKGYSIRNQSTPLEEVKIPKDKRLAYFTAEDKPKPVLSGRDYLYLASEYAINFLKERSEKGYFLMIEGSQIDWGGHANSEEYIISEMLDFDKTVGRVLDMAAKDGHTLVVITADHETGGFSINQGSIPGKLKTGFTTGGHTAAMVPVFAYGPGAEAFTGIYQNTAIFDKISRALKME